MQATSVNSDNGNGVSQLSLSMISAREIEADKRAAASVKQNRNVGKAFRKIGENNDSSEYVETDERQSLRMNSKVGKSGGHAIDISEKQIKDGVGNESQIVKTSNEETNLVRTETEEALHIEETAKDVDGKWCEASLMLSEAMQEIQSNGQANIKIVDLKRLTDIYLNLTDKRLLINKVFRKSKGFNFNGTDVNPHTAIQVNINNSNPEKAPEGGSIVS